MKKALIGLLVSGVVLIGGAVVWLSSSLDGLVADAIERYGSEALGAQVSVGSVELDLVAGRGTIRRLRVANPQGFSAGEAVAFDELTVQVDPASVTGSPIVLPQIRLIAPQIRLEVQADGTSNIDALRRNAQAYAPSEGGSAGEPSAVGEGDTSGDVVRLRIASIQMEAGGIAADLRAVGDEEREVPLPAFQLTDVGGARGAAPADLAKEIATSITAQVARRVARARLQKAVEDEIDERLAGRPEGEMVKDALRSLGLSGSD